MKVGDVAAVTNCLSRREQIHFGLLQPAGIRLDFKDAVSSVASYTIISASTREGKGVVVLWVKHSMLDGAFADELLAIAKENGGWRIDGEQGKLPYPHHPRGLPLPFSEPPNSAR